MVQKEISVSGEKLKRKLNGYRKTGKIEDKIIIIRNEQVLLDSDVAEIYGVKTKRINEAVKNNPAKFSPVQ